MFHHVCHSDLPITCPCFRTVEDLFRPSEKLLLTDEVALMLGSQWYLAHDGSQYYSIKRHHIKYEHVSIFTSEVGYGKCYATIDGGCFGTLIPLFKVCFRAQYPDTTLSVDKMPYMSETTRMPLYLLRKHEIGQGLHCKCIAYPLECNYSAHNAAVVKKWWRQWKNRFGCQTIEQLRIRVWIVLKWLNGIYPSLCKDVRMLIHRHIFAVDHYS
jgi:hypothetical protein